MYEHRRAIYSNISTSLKVRGQPNEHILLIHFPESAEFFYSFDSNIGAQCFVNTEKFIFEVDGLRKRRRQEI